MAKLTSIKFVLSPNIARQKTKLTGTCYQGKQYMEMKNQKRGPEYMD